MRFSFSVLGAIDARAIRLFVLWVVVVLLGAANVQRLVEGGLLGAR